MPIYINNKQIFDPPILTQEQVLELISSFIILPENMRLRVTELGEIIVDEVE